jgi:hypothetical protein
MKITYSSETSVDFQRTALLHIPEDRIVHSHCLGNFDPTNQGISHRIFDGYYFSRIQRLY